ncbi:MAG TPA: saccharopine dehydrogenase, partial [Deltaproteobacteria bacterium]|nr:saccharopine dehydrogenase [Deltaproteobacteria bacterium]
MGDPDRPWDVVLLGATGFTGQLVAEHLLRSHPDLRWAIAGRDPHKLRDVKMGLVGMDHRAGAIGTQVVELQDRQAMRSLAAGARVLVTTVGPYSQHGDPVVDAAVEAGTHYLDVTGEPPFVSGIRRRHSRTARDKGIKVVSCCGFDSIPADLGARFTVQQLHHGPKQVCAYLRVKARPSGGSWASLVESLSGSAPSGKLRRPRTRPPRLHRAPEEAGGGWALPLPVIDQSVV